MNGIADLYKLADVESGKPSPMMVFPVGDWTSAKYPELSLSQELANEVIANFEAEVLRTKVPIDLNHDPKSPANGWVDRLYMAPFEWNGVDGEALFADWTPNERGAQIVNDGEYAYDSLEINTITDPVTGSTYDNVLKAISLTNRPVLRMMPPVKDAGEALRLAEPVELQLSEVTAAEPDPVAELCDRIDKLLADLSTQLKGKAGIPAIRTMLREARTKASAHTMTEDPGDHAEPNEGSSAADSQSAKGDEGQDMALADGDAETKVGDQMNPAILKTLKLAEGADEAAVEAAVITLSEERDEAVSAKDKAEAELAERVKSERTKDVEAKLSELIEGGHITPGQKDEMLALSEDSPAGFDRACEILKTAKAIELGELGTSAGGESSDDDVTVELDRRAKKLADERGVDYGQAISLALSEDEAFATRYQNREL